MFRAGLLIFSGNVLTSLLLLARNLIVARFISVENYGISTTFAVSMAIVEMMSALGLQQQIVQAENGDDPHFQASLQGFQLLRGTMSGIALYVLSDPIASFLDIPQAAWAYRVLSLVPVMNALTHFDIYRLNRRMKFLPMILTGVVPAFISLSITWPLSLWYGDYRVMLYAILAQAILCVVTSHLTAERSYRLVLDWIVVGQSLRFGWPILINGAFLFLSINGDRIIVGRFFGMEQLAIFSMGMTLASTPILLIERTAQSLFLPKLAQERQDDQLFQRTSLLSFQAHMASGIIILIGAIYLSSPFIDLIIGEHFAPLIPLLVLLAVQQVIHAFKNGNSPSSIAMAQTSNSLFCSLPKVMALPVAAWFAKTGGSLETIIWIGILSELTGFVITLFLSNLRLRMPLQSLIIPILLSLASLAAATQAGLFMALLATVFGITAILSMRALRAFFRRSLGVFLREHLSVLQ